PPPPSRGGAVLPNSPKTRHNSGHVCIISRFRGAFSSLAQACQLTDFARAFCCAPIPCIVLAPWPDRLPVRAWRVRRPVAAHHETGNSMLLMIDNYDSFTYNIVQYFGELGEAVHVARNDQITLAEIEALAPD